MQKELEKEMRRKEGKGFLLHEDGEQRTNDRVG